MEKKTGKDVVEMEANSFTNKIEVGCGNLYITINRTEKRVLLQIGKAGGCMSSSLETMGNLISLLLKKGVALIEIIEALQGLRCHNPRYDQGEAVMIKSCSDAIARYLEKNLQEINTFLEIS